MGNQNLQELVKKARGNRTKRKYAEDSGVNVAIISRIESGDYSPGKKVLERLTSHSAKPQGGVTYSDLLEAANDNKQYLKGLAAVSATVGMLATPLGGMSIPILAGLLGGKTLSKDQELEFKQEKLVKNKNENFSVTELKDMATGMERYKATAVGTILATLAGKGIKCRPGQQEDTDFPINYTDFIVLVEETDIDNWILSCFTLNEENKNMEAIIKPFAARFVEKLLHTKPNPKKKASFVVDDDGLFEYLLEITNVNSYRGNLSIIQFDAKNVKIVREQYVAHYDLNDSEDKMLIVE